MIQAHLDSSSLPDTKTTLRELLNNQNQKKGRPPITELSNKGLLPTAWSWFGETLGFSCQNLRIVKGTLIATEVFHWWALNPTSISLSNAAWFTLNSSVLSFVAKVPKIWNMPLPLNRRLIWLFWKPIRFWRTPAKCRKLNGCPVIKLLAVTYVFPELLRANRNPCN